MEGGDSSPPVDRGYQMQTGDDKNLLLPAVRNLESLKVQLYTFQGHLKQVESVRREMVKYSSTELESFRLKRNLIMRKIGDLQAEIGALEREKARPPSPHRT